LAVKDFIECKHKNKLLFAKYFQTLVLLFAILSVAVACIAWTSLCCSRYQRQRRLCSMC